MVARRVLPLLAVSAGLTVANLYYNQPLLALMAQSLHVDAGAVGAIPTVTQLGYGAAMLFLVPLGDRYERRGLIVRMTLASAVALVLFALSAHPLALAASSLVLGATSMVPQYIVPYAAGIVDPGKRGSAVGKVMGGLLVGILLSRTVSGLVGARFGWRVMYGAAAAAMVVLAIVLRAALPEQRPERFVPIRELFGSIASLVRKEPVLRLHSALGALTFGAFSVFWSTLAFHLAALPQHYGSATAGAFGVLGAAGAIAAPLVGRFADRRDPRLVNGVAIAIVLTSFLVFAALGGSLAGIGAGVLLLDVGAQSNHISNQARVFSLAPSMRSRVNTVYMSSYFAGGAAGSAAGIAAWSFGGWIAVSCVGALMSALALGLFVVFRNVAPRPSRAGAADSRA